MELKMIEHSEIKIKYFCNAYGCMNCYSYVLPLQSFSFSWGLLKCSECGKIDSIPLIDDFCGCCNKVGVYISYLNEDSKVVSYWFCCHQIQVN